MRAVLFSALAAAAIAAASPASAAQEELTTGQAGQVVDALVGEMSDYFDPAKADQVRQALRTERPRLAAIHDRFALAQALSAITLKVSGDPHMKVSVATGDAKTRALSEADQALLDQRLAHGLMAVRRLPANIGYLKLRLFGRDPASADMIDAAMGLLKDTDALIIDLRENTGGGGAADTRLEGQLSATPLVMAEVHWRRRDGTTEVETRRPDIPPAGPLYPDRPVYVLVGGATFSAAEAFAYDLQANRRALLVGAVTRGGGNAANLATPGLGFGLMAFVPNGQVIHPLTGRGWNIVGLKPDVQTPVEGALTEAYRLALAAARPRISTPKSEKERADAIADPAAALMADQRL